MPPEVVNDVFACAMKKQTGVSLKYMLDFGANPFERQMILSAQVKRAWPPESRAFPADVAWHHPASPPSPREK